MYTDAKAGTVDYVNLNTLTMETAKSEGLYDQYAVVSDTDATSYMGFYNINRTATANANDGTTAKSTKSDEEIREQTKHCRTFTSEERSALQQIVALTMHSRLARI